MATAIGHAELAARLHAQLDRLERRQDAIPFLDDPDMRFRNRVWRPEPIAKAVMFCLMDVSASMDEMKKDLAKRFFALLYLFLTRKYQQVDLVFIRHTDDAEEVDEDTFFHDHALGRHRRVLGAGARRQDPDRALRDGLERLRGAGVRRRRVRRRPGAQRALPAREAAAAAALLHVPGARARQPPTRGRPRCGPSTSGWPRRAARSRCGAPPAASRSIPCSASCSGRRPTHEQHPSSPAPTGTSSSSSATTRAIAKVAGRVRPRHLRQPDRGHHLRADARRLRVERPAGRLPALVVRQGVHPQRAGVSPRHAGARLRDRDQLRSVHRVPHGGEHDHDAGAGHRARVLRPQLVLQGQRAVPAVDGRRRHHRLPRVRAPLRDGVRGAPRQRGGRGDHRRLPRADGARRRPLSPPERRSR